MSIIIVIDTHVWHSFIHSFISVDPYRITHPLDMESGYNNTEAEYSTDCKICFEVVFIPACRKCNLHTLINVDLLAL